MHKHATRATRIAGLHACARVIENSLFLLYKSKERGIHDENSFVTTNKREDLSLK